MALSDPKFDANIVRQILAITGGDKQKLIEMFNDPKQKHLQPAILMADMQSQALKRNEEIKQGQGQRPTVAAALGLTSPPVLPAGLGAIGPQGGAMPPVPPPPPAGLGAMPPVGMAAGGMTELPTSYGLDSLPIPDSMYDEQSFAGGGIVAFAKGDSVDAELAELMSEVRKGGPRALVAQQRIRELQQKGTGIASELSSRSPQRLADLGVNSKYPEDPSKDYRTTPLVVGDIVPGGIPESLPSFSTTPEEKAQALKDYMTNAASLFGGNVGGASGAQYTPIVDNQRAAGINALMASSATTPSPTRTPVRTPAPRGERGVADVAGGATRTGTATPEDDYGLPKAPGEFDRQKVFDEILALQGPAPGMEKMSDEDKAARKNEDLYGILAQIGFGMAAGESPNFLTNVGKATAAATPAMQEALKERRAETKEERKDELERKRLEYGARGTAAAATRAEEATMRTYNLNLAEARAKIAHDRATLALDIRKANDLAGYYRQMGRDKDAAMVDRLSKAHQRIAKNPNDIEAIAERDAIQQLLGRGLGLNRNKLTPDQALRQATNETKDINFVLPKGMTVKQYIDARKLELMGSDGGVSNPEIDDIVNQYT